MSKDLNKVILTGRLGKPPEYRMTGSGVPVTTMSVATSRPVMGQDGKWKSETEWFRVVLWNELAERAALILTKGSHVLVEGRLQTRKWEDNQGQERYTTEVVAKDFFLLERNNSAKAQERDDQQYQEETPEYQPANVGGETATESGQEEEEEITSFEVTSLGAEEEELVASQPGPGPGPGRSHQTANYYSSSSQTASSSKPSARTATVEEDSRNRPKVGSGSGSATTSPRTLATATTANTTGAVSSKRSALAVDPQSPPF